MKIKENVKWFLKYNSLKLEKEEVEKALQDEIKRLLIENQNLKASEKEYRNKLTMKNKKIRELKEIVGSDNMTNTELALNLLAEVSATEISRSRQPEGFSQTKEVTIAGGKIAGDARKALEEQLGHSVLSETNATTPELLDDTENNK